MAEITMINRGGTAAICSILVATLTVSGCSKIGWSPEKDAQTLAEAVFAAKVRQGIVSNGADQKSEYMAAYTACLKETLTDLRAYNAKLYPIAIQAHADGTLSGGQPSPKTLEKYDALLSKLSAEDTANIKEADRRFQTYASYCSDGKPVKFQWFMDPTKGLIKPTAEQAAAQAKAPAAGPAEKMVALYEKQRANQLTSAQCPAVRSYAEYKSNNTGSCIRFTLAKLSDSGSCEASFDLYNNYNYIVPKVLVNNVPKESLTFLSRSSSQGCSKASNEYGRQLTMRNVDKAVVYKTYLLAISQGDGDNNSVNAAFNLAQFVQNIDSKRDVEAYGWQRLGDKMSGENVSGILPETVAQRFSQAEIDSVETAVSECITNKYQSCEINIGSLVRIPE